MRVTLALRDITATNCACGGLVSLHGFLRKSSAKDCSGAAFLAPPKIVSDTPGGVVWESYSMNRLFHNKKGSKGYAIFHWNIKFFVFSCVVQSLVNHSLSYSSYLTHNEKY